MSDAGAPPSAAIFGYFPNRVIRSISLTTQEVKTYVGPGGVYNLADSLMPSVGGLNFSSSGLFFTNALSGIYWIH